MTAEILLLLPDGPDRRSLAAFLERQGRRVSMLADEETLLAYLSRAGENPGPLPLALVAAECLDLDDPVWNGPGFDRLCVLAADERELQRAGSHGVALVWPVPFVYPELLAALDGLDAGSRAVDLPSIAATSSTHEVDLSELLGNLGASLTPRLSAAEGWLELLLQDVQADDPAWRHLSHARRELREVDRLIRMMRTGSSRSEVFLGPVELNGLVREAIEMQGATAIPLQFEAASDLPEIIADARLVRFSLDCLLKAVLDPVARARSLTIATSMVQDEARLEIVEESHRLDLEQIKALSTPGLSLLYNSIDRGLGVPVARSCLERCGARLSVSSESGRRLVLSLHFEVERHRSSSPGEVPAGSGAEGERA